MAANLVPNVNKTADLIRVSDPHGTRSVCSVSAVFISPSYPNHVYTIDKYRRNCLRLSLRNTAAQNGFLHAMASVATLISRREGPYAQQTHPSHRKQEGGVFVWVASRLMPRLWGPDVVVAGKKGFRHICWTLELAPKRLGASVISTACAPPRALGSSPLRRPFNHTLTFGGHAQ